MVMVSVLLLVICRLMRLSIRPQQQTRAPWLLLLLAILCFVVCHGLHLTSPY